MHFLPVHCQMNFYLSRNLSNLLNDDIVPVLIVRILEYITQLTFFFFFFSQRGKKWNLSVVPFDLHFSSHKISVIALSLYIAKTCIFFFHTLSRFCQRDKAKERGGEMRERRRSERSKVLGLDLSLLALNVMEGTVSQRIRVVSRS